MSGNKLFNSLAKAVAALSSSEVPFLLVLAIAKVRQLIFLLGDETSLTNFFLNFLRDVCTKSRKIDPLSN